MEKLHFALIWIQHTVSFLGVMIIFCGVIWAIGYFLYYLLSGEIMTEGARINTIRLYLGRFLILGLEFIVAADLISTTTAPDYYSVGILAIIVLIRTLLSFSLNRELMGINQETNNTTTKKEVL